MLIYTVTQVTQCIKNLFEMDPVLQDLWVEGEISNCFTSAAGHAYLTLKDERAQVRCVIWRSQMERLQEMPANGKAVLAHGRMSVYETQGNYQLYVDQMQPLGMGKLYLQFKALKEKLEREGLFAPERKRLLPDFPQCLGVVTSPLGAAIRDILNILRRRYPLVEIIIAPTQVQGDEAPPQIVAAIQALNARASVDAIIVARGGGSLEDLWAFNDERVARAIFASRVPIVTGVGHETDFTIADFVADVRAPTPSAAAEIAVPDQETLRAQIAQQREALTQAMCRRVASSRAQVDHAQALLSRVSPRIWLERRRQELDQIEQQILVTQARRLERWRGLLLSTQWCLQTLNPEATLKRGYAIVAQRETGAIVTRTAQITAGDHINIHVSDGHFAGTVD